MHPGWAYYGGDGYVCNGPFRLAEWKRNQEIHITKNPLYWDTSQVKIREIKVSIIEDSQTALELFEKDELDWIGDPLSAISGSVLPKLSGKIQIHPVAGVYWLEFNIAKFPFSSVKLRKALSLAINRRELIEKKLFGGELPATGIVPPNMAFQKEPYFNDGDSETAKTLFQEALSEMKIRRDEIPPILLSYALIEGNEAIVTYVKEQWKEILGLNVVLEGFLWEEYFKKVTNGEFQIVALTWYSWFNDPIYNLDYLKFKGEDSDTSYYWKNSSYQNLLDQAEYCRDPLQRKYILHQAEKLLLEEMPIAPIFYSCFKYMKKDTLQGVYLSDLGQIDFKWAFVKK